MEVKIGLIQASVSEKPGENVDKAVAKIEEAAGKGAQIVCLQELFRTRYFCQSEDYACFDYAETIPGETTQIMSKIAKKNNVVLIVPLFEKRTRGLYHNSLVVIDADGSLLGTYRKMHIPDDPNYYEKFYFAPGDLGFKVFDTKYGKIAPLICWDQWYPEAARMAALKGAQIIFYPTAIGWWSKDYRNRQAEDARHAWQTIQQSHAIANGVFVASVNRVGVEGGMHFWGSSFVSNPQGRKIAEAKDKETILIAKCDLNEIDCTRQGWPFLRDRRIDAYKDITSRFLD